MFINDDYFDHDQVSKLCEETVLIRDGEADEGPSVDCWIDDPDWPTADWQNEVGSNDTRLCYLDWVSHKKEGAE